MLCSALKNTASQLAAPVAAFSRLFASLPASKKDVLHMGSFSTGEIQKILNVAKEVKKNPDAYKDHMRNKTLLMLFSKPSLRTRLSFETGMMQMGGHAIYYPLDAKAPLGVKESLYDTANVMGRYADVVMARVPTRQMVAGLAKDCNAPVINALDDWGHPCQILADFQTILEQPQFPTLNGLTMAYCGDIRNNVTYDLMRGGIIMGMHVKVAGPKGAEYELEQEAIDECNELMKENGGSFSVCETAEDACKDANIVTTDSWMSYGIPKEKEIERIKTFGPFQVNESHMAMADKDAVFLHCLPAQRGVEVTEGVIDGPHSVVFDEAENRCHAQKALMLHLLHLV